MRSCAGRPWRESSNADGRVPSETADAQARAVSAPSHGRHTSRFGISRRAAACSTDWWVGPSSPSPMLSWVSTWMTRRFMSAPIRIALRL